MSTQPAVNALTTLTSVKDELGITVDTNDGILARYINAASGRIEGYCNRSFYYDAAIAEAVAGFGSPRLVVAKTPIISITKIEFDGVELDATDYEIEGNGFAGMIWRDSGWLWTARSLTTASGGNRIAGTEKRDYVVTYKGGFVTPRQAENDETDTLVRNLPEEIEDAAIRWCVDRWSRKGEMSGVKSEKLMSHSVTYVDDDGTGLTPAIRSMLDPYVRVVQS